MSRTRTQHLRLVAEIQRSRRENAHLLVNPILKLTIVLIWKTPACLKFGKTFNRAVKNLPQRKLWVWAGNDARFIRIWSHRTSASVCFFGNDRSSHSRIRISLDPISVYYEWTSDQFAYPSPCNNSCYARASPRVKKLDQRFQDLVQPRPQGFSLEKWVGHPIHFLREKPWGRGWI